MNGRRRTHRRQRTQRGRRSIVRVFAPWIAVSSAVACATIALAAVPPAGRLPSPPKDAAQPVETTPASGELAPIPDARVQRIFPSLALKRPLEVVQAPGDDGRLFVVEQAGRVLAVDRGDRSIEHAPDFIDLRARVHDRSNEEGLLSLVFHPDFATNRTFFLYYSADPPKRTVLSRFKASDDGRIGLPDSEEVLLEVPHPWWNHKGGKLLFGPDGMLYLSIGDGGSGGDPKAAGQNLGTHLAKILRIDVNRKDPGKAYAVPADNPFVSVRGAKPEIWAYGLRNVWRMAFDRKTGELWAGDVGQNAWEEIDIITRGGNYGWNVREGAHDFSTKPLEDSPLTKQPGYVLGPQGNYVDPIVDYPRADGGSVTGGAVWRSETHPILNGVYVYGDFNNGALWGIRHEGGRTVGPKRWIKSGKARWSSIDQLNDGTIILTSMEGGERGPGALYELVPSGATSTPTGRPSGASERRDSRPSQPPR